MKCNGKLKAPELPLTMSTCKFGWWSGHSTLMVLTRLAVLLATSLADWTKCLLAAGLVVLDDARRQALQRAEVCLATMVAAERTWATQSV